VTASIAACSLPPKFAWAERNGLADDLVEHLMAPRYFVGIDLGTTNTAVASIAVDGDGTITPFRIPQVVSPGEVSAQPTLPSFLLLPTELEVPPEGLSLPWADRPGFTIGTLARERGSELPHRLVSSAKSWLCNTGVDRHAPILPWRGAETEGAADDEHEEDAGTVPQRVSPVEASGLYLEHLRSAWNHAHPDAPLEEQEVLLAVPASFDAVARELTITAAQQAGLHQVTLLEEPQAAFYSWLAHTGKKWRDHLGPGDSVLVFDIGGGTTDFSIIAVVDDGTGNLALERVAVGEHILLGGDNMDLALAHATMQKLGDRLSPLQFRGLVHACRRAKEQLLSPGAPAEIPVSILGRSSKLIGGTVRTDLVSEHVRRLVLDGFFPFVDRAARSQRRRATGLRELGLPYAHDPAITRHLAEFITRHGRAPTAVLFNGGVMKGDLLRARVSEMVGAWQGRGSVPGLAGTDLDLAVAHGAAYYGMVRAGRGIRIRGGSARSYYIGIEAAMPAIPGFAPPVKALCVVPFGMEEGTGSKLPEEELGLVVGETAEFRFFASSERKTDTVGTLVDPEDGRLDELGPVEATLPAGQGAEPGTVVPVTLESRLTEIGTLELWCVERESDSAGASEGNGKGKGKGEGKGKGARWKLEYSVRERG
jgi:molecular chaperone DnaK (HSP70)